MVVISFQTTIGLFLSRIAEAIRFFNRLDEAARLLSTVLPVKRDFPLAISRRSCYNSILCEKYRKKRVYR